MLEIWSVAIDLLRIGWRCCRSSAIREWTPRKTHDWLSRWNIWNCKQDGCALLSYRKCIAQQILVVQGMGARFYHVGLWTLFEGWKEQIVGG
jgi:hypothetical protein